MQDPSILSWAEFYARRDWALFPVHGYDSENGCTCDAGHNCSNPGKHPANSNGFKGATSEEFLIERLFANGDRNIGLATGEKSGVFVIDVDGPEGERSLTELQHHNDALPRTLQARTGRGRHLFFAMPAGVVIPSKANVLGHKVDIRGDGGYVILPPSAHVSGVQYEWIDRQQEIAEAPKWLIPLVQKAEAPPLKADGVMPREPDAPAGSHKHKLIMSMLDALDPDMPYDDWYKVGMSVKAFGGPFAAWDEWSARGDKYKASEMVSKWNSFSASGGVTDGTLAMMAEAAGWENPFVIPVELDPVQPPPLFVEDFGPEEDLVAPPPMPFDPTKLSGLIGDTVRWIVHTAMLPQPELALMATLGALAGVAGRKYATRHNTRCNMYLCGLAPSGAGKDHPRKSIKLLFDKASIREEHLGPENFTSGPGLMTSLTKKPCQVMLVDELGMVFGAMKGESAPGFKREVLTILTQAYSSSGAPHFTSGEYSDEKKGAKVVDYPALTVYGTSTESEYAAALSRSMVESGELNRWVVLPSSKGRPKRNFDAAYVPPPDDLWSRWQAIGAAEPVRSSPTDVTSTNDPRAVPDPILVVYTTEAEEYLTEVWNTQDERLAEGGDSEAMWARLAENTIKIAMLFAISKAPTKPVISKEDVQYGLALVETSIRYIIYLLNTAVSDSKSEKEHKMIVDAILKSEDRGLSSTYLARRFGSRIVARRRQEIISDAIEADLIAEVHVQGDRGRPSRLYKGIAYAEENN